MGDLYAIAKLLVIVFIIIVVLYLIFHLVLAIFAIAPYGVHYPITAAIRPLGTII